MNAKLVDHLDENRRLKSENQSLKKDLLCAIDGQHGKNTSPKDRKGEHTMNYAIM